MCETKNFYLWLLQVVVLSGLLVFFLWLSLHPKSPTYTIVDFSLPDLSNQKAPPPAGEDGHNATVSFQLDVENGNKNSDVYYDDIDVTLYYGVDNIGVKRIPSFNQDKQQKDHFHGKVESNGRTWREIVGAVSKNGTAQFEVGLVTRVRYKVWFVKTRSNGVKRQGRVPIGSDGKIWGKKKRIKLHRGSRKLKGFF